MPSSQRFPALLFAGITCAALATACGVLTAVSGLPALSPTPLAPEPGGRTERFFVNSRGSGPCELSWRTGGSSLSLVPVATFEPARTLDLELDRGGYFRIHAVTALDDLRLFVMGTDPQGSIAILGIAHLGPSAGQDGPIPVECLYWGTEVSGRGDCDWLATFPSCVVLLDTERQSLCYFLLEERGFLRVANGAQVEDLAAYTSVALYAARSEDTATDDTLLIRLANRSSAPAHLLGQRGGDRWLWDAGADGMIDLIQKEGILTAAWGIQSAPAGRSLASDTAWTRPDARRWFARGSARVVASGWPRPSGRFRSCAT